MNAETPVAPELEEGIEIAKAFLERRGRSFDWVVGALIAAASGPDPIEAVDVMGVVVGEEPIAGDPDAEPSIRALLQLYVSFDEYLSDGEAISPPPEETERIAAFCDGYVAGAALHPRWRKDEAACVPLFAMAILAGKVEPELELDYDEKPITEEWRAAHRAEVGDYVAELFEYWNDARRLRDAPPRTKVGRNDPCPCGSGKKYKKCCSP